MKLASIEAIVRGLNEAGVQFLVVGGLAVVVHGYGRQTRDMDLVVRLEPVSIRATFAALAKLGYHPRVPVTAESFSDPEQRQAWIREKGMLVLNFHSDQHPTTPIDLFVTEPFDFVVEFAASEVEELWPGVPMRVPRLQTLIRLKEQAGRPQDVVDVAELRRIHQEDDNA